MAYFNGKPVKLNANVTNSEIPEGVVLYNDAQYLTNAQKQQARENIGAGTGGEVDLSGVVACLNDIKALLEKGVFTEDITSLMAQLAEDIEALEPIPSDYDVSFAEGVLTINKAPAEKNGSVLTIL